MAEVGEVAYKKDVDFWTLLHELRTRRLRSMPAGARTVLSGGCSSSWYFDWFAQNYPGISRHIGVEAFLPRPAALPAGAEWHTGSLASLSGIRDGDVDLVFAGQVIEHLWPDEAAGFLVEAHRVLGDEGLLVLDSPNRRLTPALGFENYEHTMEFTVDEIVRAVRLAGFEPTAVMGVWLCYDRDDHRVLPLEHQALAPPWTCDDRIQAATDRPEDSFVWWLEARRQRRDPDGDALLSHLSEIFGISRALNLTRFSAEVGSRSGSGRNAIVRTNPGEAGYLVRGPRVPVRTGSYLVRFEVGMLPGQPTRDSLDALPGVLDVWSTVTATILAQRELRVRDLPTGRMASLDLPCVLDQTAFGVEFRLRSTGQVGLVAHLGADLLVADEASASPESADSEAPRGDPGMADQSDLVSVQQRLRALRDLRAPLFGPVEGFPRTGVWWHQPFYWLMNLLLRLVARRQLRFNQEIVDLLETLVMRDPCASREPRSSSERPGSR